MRKARMACLAALGLTLALPSVASAQVFPPASRFQKVTLNDLGQARRHADEIVFLHKGRLIEHAEAARFFMRPATPEARAFVAGELLS